MSHESAPEPRQQFIELANSSELNIQDLKRESLYQPAVSKHTDSVDGQILRAVVNGHEIELGEREAGESGGHLVWVKLDGKEVFAGEDMSDESEELKEAVNILEARLRGATN